eukprot:CAMPEP_0171343504 /NCGR_PEP_ID=MMETSP0878-20121228/17326_1 /TAXON_ID=67004 /ORGANISM="Thalassiosira weissflogii, Strain CCMP1336" /LENGTH=379 /DNA_ID=CAMNT_0011846463 /DNA_START=36 /DNA_END=1175 /DNA_ORIENTATION=+
MTTSAAAFRAKTIFMKSWKPRDPPSNRDRLELYALHKQSVSGDAPAKEPPDASVADKAKLTAWRNKRGLSQAEAMHQYVSECDRQIRVYGTRGAADKSSQNNDQGGGVAGEGSSSHTPMFGASTPQNTPSGISKNEQDSNVLLCPRGLAAIPLLCAAASESRAAYLARMRQTHPTNGWWAKQEPLCLEVNNPLSFPEKLIIGMAALVEKLSLYAGGIMAEDHTVLFLSPRVAQSFLWPLHNVFLSAWIAWILTCTYCGSVAMMTQTLLFGAKRTNIPLNRLFLEEINPAARAVESLCEQHQTISVRISGLALMPMMILCDWANVVVARVGIFVGSVVFVSLGAMTWWYWICILPWLGIAGICLAVMSGWCFSLIELSGN